MIKQLVKIIVNEFNVVGLDGSSAGGQELNRWSKTQLIVMYSTTPKLKEEKELSSVSQTPTRPEIDEMGQLQ